LSVEYPEVVLPAEIMPDSLRNARRLRQLTLAMRIINDDVRMRERWLLTSYLRGDNRAHRNGLAADFALRSGPLWRLRRIMICPKYDLHQPISDAIVDSLPEIIRYCPDVHLILIEPDHLHIELSSLQHPRRLDVISYASRPNGLCPNVTPSQDVIASQPL
jgi:hypothetical protein